MKSFSEKFISKEGFIRREKKTNYYVFIRIDYNEIITDMIIINNLENQDNYLCISDLSNFEIKSSTNCGLLNLELLDFDNDHPFLINQKIILFIIFFKNILKIT